MSSYRLLTLNSTTLSPLLVNDHSSPKILNHPRHHDGFLYLHSCMCMQYLLPVLSNLELTMLDICQSDDLPFFLNWIRTRTCLDLCSEPNQYGQAPGITEFWIIEPKPYRAPKCVILGTPILWPGRRKVVARFSNNFVTLLGTRQMHHDMIHLCVNQYNMWLTSEHDDKLAKLFTVTIKADHTSRQLYERYDQVS